MHRQQSSRASSRGGPLFAGIADFFHGGGGDGSGVDADPELLPSSAPAGVAGDGHGSGNYAGLFADCDDAWSARTASGVKSGISVEGWSAVGNGCRGHVAGEGWPGRSSCSRRRLWRRRR